MAFLAAMTQIFTSTQLPRQLSMVRVHLERNKWPRLVVQVTSVSDTVIQVYLCMDSLLTDTRVTGTEVTSIHSSQVACLSLHLSSQGSSHLPIAREEKRELLFLSLSLPLQVNTNVSRIQLLNWSVAFFKAILTATLNVE